VRRSRRHGGSDGVRTDPEFRRGFARRAGDDRRRLREAGRHLSHYQLEDGGADRRYAAAGDGADQDGRHRPDGEGAGCGVGIVGPIAMLVVVFVVTALVGLFVSNSATAVLIGPIAIDAAQTLHVSPYAFAMTVSIACCAAYVTPVSSPVNMLVMEPGGYAFGDYVKIGLPLLLLTLLVTVALVAVIYPL
jgi:Citrate transporter